MANEKMGCTEVAVENYRKAVSLAPGNTEYQNRLNNLLEKSNKHSMPSEAPVFESANSNESELNIITPVFTEIAKSEEPMSYEKLVAKADEAYQKQDYENAIDYYTKAVIYNPSDKNLLLKIANLYKLTGNNSKAISFYDKIITLDPENSDAYFNKGLVYANQKDYDNCISCFEKVIQLSPDYPYAYYSIGMAYEQKGLTYKALEYYYLYSGLESDAGVLSVVEQKIKKLEAK